MKDQYGREINYMRISVTDRCNLHCSFCNPKEGICYQDFVNILNYDEIMKAVRAVIPLGIRNFRITGGEPLVREGIVCFIRDLKRTAGVDEVYLTTNGTLLEQHLEALTEAGLDGVNISLCSAYPKEYETITGHNSAKKVISAILASAGFGLHTKVNCVSRPDMTPEQYRDIADLARDYPIDVRFIEMMPIGYGTSFRTVSGKEILKQLEEAYGKASPGAMVQGNGPAEYYRFPDFTGHLGFINARSCSFCGRCNRVRLTADGWLKLCLSYEEGLDLREMLRSNASVRELTLKIGKAILLKPVQHDFNQRMDHAYRRNVRAMSQIGG